MTHLRHRLSAMNVRQIFWDNDGVLVDTERYYMQASREALGKIGIDLSDNQFATISLTEGRSIFDLASDSGIEERTIGELRQWRNERYTQLLEKNPVAIEGALETLQRLHGRIPMAIVTSSLKLHFMTIHCQSGFLDYIDFYLAREDYRQSKPSPEAYLMALRKSGARAEETLVIEDSPRGLEAARKAGLSCWVIPGGYTQKQHIKHADRVLTSISEIPELLL